MFGVLLVLDGVLLVLDGTAAIEQRVLPEHVIIPVSGSYKHNIRSLAYDVGRSPTYILHEKIHTP